MACGLGVVTGVSLTDIYADAASNENGVLLLVTLISNTPTAGFTGEIEDDKAPDSLRKYGEIPRKRVSKQDGLGRIRS